MKEAEKQSQTIAKRIKKITSFSFSNIPFLFLAGFINTLGVNFFLVANEIIDGGFSGTAILLNFITGYPISIFLLVLNIPLFLIGIKKLGFSFIIYSIIGVGSYSLWMYVFSGQSVPLENVIVAVVFGGLLSGIGSGLTIRYGGCLDGIEVIAVLLNKKIGLSVGTLVMMYNIVIMSVAVIFVGWDNGLFSILAYAVGIKAVDFVVEGLDKAKAAIIITHKGNEVAEVLSERMDRGVTMLSGKGYYTQQEKSVLYFVVNRFEVVKLKQLIYAVDPGAFVSINEVSEVLGHSGTKKKFATNTSRGSKQKKEDEKTIDTHTENEV